MRMGRSVTQPRVVVDIVCLRNRLYDFHLGLTKSSTFLYCQDTYPLVPTFGTSANIMHGLVLWSITHPYDT